MDTCPAVGSPEGPAVLQNLDMRKFSGDWYLSWFTKTDPEDNYNCLAQRYSSTDKKGALKRQLFYNNVEDVANQHVTQFQTEGPATGEFTIAGKMRHMQVVDTDYFSYAIVYECTPENQKVSIYTRSPDYGPKELDSILAVAKKQLKLDQKGSSLDGKKIDKFLTKMKTSSDECKYPVQL